MHNRARLTALLLLLPLAQIACDSSGDPPPPQVAGVYSGDMIYRFSFPDETVTVTARGRFEVLQAGTTVTISGKLTLEGEIFDLAAITGEINATGFFTPTAGGAVGDYRDPDCGQFTTTSASVVFSGGNLRLQETYVTDACGDISASGLFAREG